MLLMFIVSLSVKKSPYAFRQVDLCIYHLFSSTLHTGEGYFLTCIVSGL